MAEEVQNDEEQQPLGAQVEGADGEAQEVAENAAEPEEPELSIVIEGAAPEEEDDVSDEDLSDKGRRAVQRLREAAREASKREREARAKLAEIEARTQAAVQPIKKPTLEGCGFDEAIYEREVREYVKAEAEDVARREAAAKAEETAQADYHQRHERYKATKAALRVQDYDDAEDKVREALSREQQSILIRNLDDPAKVIYALGRHEKVLKELAAVKDQDRFAYRLAKLEGEVKVTTKSPPPAETRLRGGTTSGASVVGLQSRLAAAEKAANETGNYDAVFEIKRQIKAAGVKA